MGKVETTSLKLLLSERFRGSQVRRKRRIRRNAEPVENYPAMAYRGVGFEWLHCHRRRRRIIAKPLGARFSFANAATTPWFSARPQDVSSTRALLPDRCLSGLARMSPADRTPIPCFTRFVRWRPENIDFRRLSHASPAAHRPLAFAQFTPPLRNSARIEMKKDICRVQWHSVNLRRLRSPGSTRSTCRSDATILGPGIAYDRLKHGPITTAFFSFAPSAAPPTSRSRIKRI